MVIAFDSLEEDIFNEKRLNEALGYKDAQTVLAIWKKFKGMKGASVFEALQLAERRLFEIEDSIRDTSGSVPKGQWPRVRLVQTVREAINGFKGLALDADEAGK